MAKHKGILKLKGTMGDVTFYKTTDGYMAREKGGIERNRIMNDPAFKRTRENGQEFRTAGKGGQLIRKSQRLLLRQVGDNRVTGRLVQELMRVIKIEYLRRYRIWAGAKFACRECGVNYLYGHIGNADQFFGHGAFEMGWGIWGAVVTSVQCSVVRNQYLVI